jgi:hypothetical protein
MIVAKYFFISNDTFEVLGQLQHWKVYWTQGNLTT